MEQNEIVNGVAPVSDVVVAAAPKKMKKDKVEKSAKADKGDKGDKIDPNTALTGAPSKFRFDNIREFDQKKLKSFAARLKEVGQLMPILVRPDMTVIDGERRVRALEIAEMDVKYLIVPEGSDGSDALRHYLMSIGANIDREDVSPVDRAKQMHHLRTEFGMSVKEVAEVFGISTGLVSQNVQPVEKLPEYVLDLVRKNKMTMAAAYELSKEDIEPEKLKDTVEGLVQKAEEEREKYNSGVATAGTSATGQGTGKKKSDRVSKDAVAEATGRAESKPMNGKKMAAWCQEIIDKASDEELKKELRPSELMCSVLDIVRKVAGGKLKTGTAEKKLRELL